MKLILQFYKIVRRIIKINQYILNPYNYENIDNPFIRIMPRTYVWIDNDDSNKEYKKEPKSFNFGS